MSPVRFHRWFFGSEPLQAVAVKVHHEATHAILGGEMFGHFSAQNAVKRCGLVEIFGQK